MDAMSNEHLSHTANSRCYSALDRNRDVEEEMIRREFLKRFIVAISVIISSTFYAPALAQTCRILIAPDH